MSLPVDLSNIVVCQKLTMVLVSIGTVILTLEDLTKYKTFKDTELLSWEVSSLSYPWMTNRVLNWILHYFCAYSRYKYLMIAKLVSALLIISLAFIAHNIILSVLLFIATVSSLSLNIRNPFGTDGSHQMSIIVYSCLFLSSIAEEQSLGQQLCFWFIAIQSVLSYFVAGVYKLISTSWQNGKALVGIFSTDIYGNQWVYDLLRNRPHWSKACSWMIIAYECMFPVVLLVDLNFMILILLTGFLFHLSSAIFMSLNIFLWMFIATYPSIIYCSTNL